MLPGETIISGASNTCYGDGLIRHPMQVMEFQILMSNAGYYIGTQCDYCGPYSRESGYFGSHEAARNALDNVFTPR